jgi:malonate-semialdehyde dehydrogenase (acetylating)/methylmalonate-semialdehyde dehydrogenase
MAELGAAAGIPAGVLSVVHGGKQTVEALVGHDDIKAVAFVGSTAVAKSVYLLAAQHGKRALCLGGAKNHLIAVPDADDELTARAVVDSFTGCAGQRCMAGSVFVPVGGARRITQRISEIASQLRLGAEMGALIDGPARERLVSAIARAESDGAEVLLDGRKATPPAGYDGGYWLGPTILSGVKPGMACAQDELFGPVLSVVEVNDLDAALELEKSSPYGNATSIFTQSGAIARYVSEQSTTGMIGVNIGVPVPREPFSFGGTKSSRFGHGDITGASGLDFWTQYKKITSKWALQTDQTWMS